MTWPSNACRERLSFSYGLPITYQCQKRLDTAFLGGRARHKSSWLTETIGNAPPIYMVHAGKIGASKYRGSHPAHGATFCLFINLTIIVSYDPVKSNAAAATPRSHVLVRVGGGINDSVRCSSFPSWEKPDLLAATSAIEFCDKDEIQGWEFDLRTDKEITV